MTSTIRELQDILADGARIHMMGIGGAGMRGLARLLAHDGQEVTGCDTRGEKARNIREKHGIETYTGHEPGHIHRTDQRDVDLLIHSAAVPDTSDELQHARDEGLPTATYSRGLAALFNEKSGIAVAGTHGKTTCSAMLSVVLKSAGFDPGALVGGVLQDWETSSRVGDGDYFVAEACEFGENFRAMKPDHVLLTNIDRSHLDYYDHAEEIEHAFERFLSRQDPMGYVVTESDSDAISRVVKEARGKVQRISPDGERDWWLRSTRENGQRFFTVQSNGDQSPSLPVPMEGKHQVMNAAQVAVLARLLGAKWPRIKAGLQNFQGVHRRFEIHRDGSEGGPVVIDDYGHHPEEVYQTISAVRESYPNRELIVCFQPHQFSRTYHFREDWAGALETADEVWLTPIYEARDSAEACERISIDDVAERVRDTVRDTHVLAGPKEAGRRMKENASGSDVYLTIGAGDIWKAVDEFESSDSRNKEPVST